MRQSRPCLARPRTFLLAVLLLLAWPLPHGLAPDGPVLAAEWTASGPGSAPGDPSSQDGAESPAPGQTGLARPDALLDAAVLRTAYPGLVRGLALDAHGRTVLVLAQGQRLIYDDGRSKTRQEALDAPDIQDMLEQVYPLTPYREPPTPGFDPGRRRVQPLFLALYGENERDTGRRLVTVDFLGRRVAFHARHGAADALARVSSRVAPLLAARPGMRPLIFPLGGTFCWRVIAGTNRLSVHSFGAALDLNENLPYWRTYKGPGQGQGQDLGQGTAPDPGLAVAESLAFPADVVEAFEAEGFIWGGKWAAFDLMHFEYRPELILKSRVLAGELPRPEPVPVLGGMRGE